MSEVEAGALPIDRLRHLQRLARISYLDPAIVRVILEGKKPSHISARDLWRMGGLPLGWAEQSEAQHLATN